jgi:hypothetical protein
MNLSVRYLGISHDDCNKNEKWLRADGMHGLVTFMKLVNLHTLALAKSSTTSVPFYLSPTSLFLN